MRRTLVFAVLAGAAMPSLAQNAPALPGTLEVVGHAARAVAPDLASIQVGVSARAGNPAAALDAASTAARVIAERAKQNGIAAADIRTGNVSLTPTFKTLRDPGGGSQSQPDGYQAENSVELRVRDLGRLGEVLRLMVEGGANRIGGLSFGLADPRPLNEAVRADAVADGVRQARLLAEAAGVRLGPIKHIGFAAQPGPGRPLRMEARAMAVPIEAGNLEVSADVQMTWLIEQP